MSRLIDIPIRVESLERIGGLGGGVAAVLSELTAMLEQLSRGGASLAIDLRSLPMSPDDRGELQRVLGRGEVEATLNAEGSSTFLETRMSGIWWVTHRDREGKIIAELIEVTRLPQILFSSADEICASVRAMQARTLSSPLALSAEVTHATRQ